MAEIVAVVIADPAIVSLEADVLPAATRFLGMELAARAVLAADRLGADAVWLIGDRAAIAGLATRHAVRGAIGSGSPAEVAELLRARPRATALVLSPWMVVRPRYLELLLERGAERLTLAVSRHVDPVRPWPDARLDGFAIAQLAHHDERPDGQALPLLAGPAGDVADLLRAEPGELMAALASRRPGQVGATILPADSHVTLLAPRDRPGAARWLFAGVASSADGLVDRHVNRRFSRYVTLAVIDHPVTPNQITAAALVMGLVAVGLFATGRYALAVAGAALLQLSAIVDCADGELARLKHLESRLGALLDIVADNVVHVGLFLAIGLAVSRQGGGTLALALGAAAAAGALISFLLVVSELGRAAAGGPVARLIERMTNRDFTLLLLTLAVADRLAWFLWLLAIGVQLFWIAVATLKVRAFFDRRQGAEADR